MHQNTANKVHSYSHLALTEREEIAIGIELGPTFKQQVQQHRLQLEIKS